MKKLKCDLCVGEVKYQAADARAIGRHKRFVHGVIGKNSAARIKANENKFINYINKATENITPVTPEVYADPRPITLALPSLENCMNEIERGFMNLRLVVSAMRKNFGGGE